MKDIEKYLENKMMGARPTGNNSNVGATLLKFDKSGNTLQSYIEETLQTLLVCSQRSDTIGIFKLTMASTKVGNRLMKMMGQPDAPFSQKVRLGDLMIEALFNLKYVKIYRDPSYSKNAERAPYVVQLGDRWGEIADFPIAKTKEDLRGTFFESPKYPSKDIVKRCKYTKDEWEIVKNSQHIIAAHKLQQKEFSVNSEVLRVLKKNKANFVETKVIPIPTAGNKKKTDDAYYSMRMAMNKAKGKLTKDVINKKKKYNKLAEEWNLKLIALKAHSKRTAFEYTIQKATILDNVDKFYQTIELDYRGRFYYVESFFNFQGTDASRGIIQFAEGKPITERGERWLAIHTAASYNQSYGINEIPDYFEEDYKAYLESEGLDSISVDKMTLDDRAMWTYQNMDMIYDSVSKEYMHPEAEKPVTFYACCLEWTKYLADKENHLSHLPIQIDGEILAVIKPCEFRGYLTIKLKTILNLEKYYIC